VTFLKQKKKICVLGLGYIGLPTAAMFATHGYEIIGVDVNNKVVEALNQGKIIIEEPYLDIMVQAAVTSGNLIGNTKPNYADIFIIAVPTPIKPNKTADMSYVISATESIIPFLRKGNIIILESTSPVGTINELLIPILSKSGLVIGDELYVAHCPERVLPGRILMELVENNRIIGGINKKSGELVKELYKTFVRGNIFLTNATTAEMCKLMENTYRDVNIALANEVARICDQMKINVWEVTELCNKHPRVNLHQPGPGVGGHCLTVDPFFIIERVPEVAKIIGLGRKINDSMPEYVVEKIKEALKQVSALPKITILGATYKPDIDDIRESPILKIIDILVQNKFKIVLVDPHIKSHPYLEKDLYKAVESSDLLLLAVNHREFKNLQFERIVELMRTPIIFDTRNFYEANILRKLGFKYILLGKGNRNLGEEVEE
jgi:UDP-N-acetyl-D-mannosaminuronic acid dehydrogenase